jgi:polysaccharide pyruvyl transferase WcaK-like protein
MRIGLLGQFGSGNTGNDGSLEAMLNFLRSAKSDAQIVCICSNPTAIAERFGVDAISIGGASADGKWFGRINRLLADVPRRLTTLCSVFTQLQGVDVLAIPGTGILDDFQENAFGWPFVVFRWCLAARLRGVRVAFVSIGAGPIEGSLSRWFLKKAAQMAGYRSYRDDFSLRYVEKIGIDVRNDKRYPDLAFSLPSPSLPQKLGARPTVGVGVMDYHGWSKVDANGETIHDRYTDKLAAYIVWLLKKDFDVRLLTGDLRDDSAVGRVVKKIASTAKNVPMERITTTRSSNLQELMQDIACTDFVVVSRYHNVVCALKLGRPIISLSYNQKNDYLLSQFGQADYCEQIETFDLERLEQMTDRIVQNLKAIREQIDACNKSVREKLAEQERFLLGGFLAG